MEALYAKLYDKYDKLKKKKLIDMDEINREQEVKFLNYVSAAEELIQHLKSENDKLHAQINDLRSEVASVRSAKDKECAEYQKLLMGENQKNKELSEEVERLQKLHQKGLSCSLKDKCTIIQLNTPESAKIAEPVSKSTSRRMTRKRSRESAAKTEKNMVALGCRTGDDVMVREKTRDLSKGTLYNQQLKCCRTFNGLGDGVDDSSLARCMFQALIEYLVGMKLSTMNQAEGICITALHQSSGYSFSLTWVNKAAGEEAELLYRIVSLGTFERVAPEWMRDDVMFSTSMCPMFFERVARMIKLHC